MKKTTWIKFASLSALCTTVVSTPVLAGNSYVENDFSVRSLFSGQSQTDVMIDAVRESQREASSQSSKIGTSYTETLQRLKGDIDGFRTKQKFKEVDKFDISSYSNSFETASDSSTEDIRVSDSYNYNGIDKVHRVTAGFDF